MFSTYLQLGFEHITDPNGYDHMLFLLALCAAYRYGQFRRILVLITAFTIGHSLTLALAVLNIIPVNAAIIEFLIPVTILLTSVKNLLKNRRTGHWLSYVLALIFGLVHGMGFSNYLRSLLADDLLLPLFSFNLGIELGQMLVVSIIFLAQFLFLYFLGLKHRSWNIAASLVAGSVSLILSILRFPFLS